VGHRDELTDNDLKFKELCRAIWNDRVRFVKSIIGVDRIDPLQEELLRKLDAHDHVSAKAGHGTGKTTSLAWIVLHYMSTRPMCKIPCTAPSKHQLFDVLWPELSKWHNHMKKTEKGLLFARNLDWTKEKLSNLMQPEEWFAVARTATKENPEALQGFHADYILNIVDEASGVDDDIFEVLEGSYGTKETKSIWMGNPTRCEGAFYRSFGDEKKFFDNMTMSCIKSSLPPRRYIDRMAQKYGLDSNMYRVRVLGEFPEKEGDSYIPLALCVDARHRDIPLQIQYKKVFGVDVARYGDDESVIAIRQGDMFHPYHVLRNKNTMELAGFVASLANKEKPEAIFIDVIGIGAGVYDRLKELGFNVIAINVAEVPYEFPQKYKRLRDELWGKMRDWLEARRGKIWDNEDMDLSAQLSGPKYKVTSDGKIQIESKDDMKKRGIKSPDIADAHIMTFAQPISNYNTDLTNNDGVEYDMNSFEPLDRKVGY